MTEAIDTVLFDLDDTLCAYRREPHVVLEAAFERAGLDPIFDVTAYYDRYDDYLEESDDVHDLRRRCFADLAAEAGHDRDAGHAVARAFTEERDQRAVELRSGARVAVDALALEHRLALVTNGDPGMQRRKLEAVGLAEDFETIVCAGYDTPAKPSPEPFDTALEALEATPDRAVHVGNSLTTDVAGARAAGLRTAWIPADGSRVESPEPEPDYALESLADLRPAPWL